MAVENMYLMSGIFVKKDIDEVLKKIITQGSLHLTEESMTSRYTLEVLKSKNEEIVKNLKLDTSLIKSYDDELKKKHQDILTKLLEIFDFFKLDYLELIKKEKNNLNIEIDESNFEKIYNKYYEIEEEFHKVTTKKQDLDEYNNLILFLLNFGVKNFKITDLRRMKYIDYKVGKVPHSSYESLKENYENIDEVIYHIGTSPHTKNTEKEEIVIIFSAKNNISSIDKLLDSLNFTSINLPNIGYLEDYTAENLQKAISVEEEKINLELKDIENKKSLFIRDNIKTLLSIFYKIKVFNKASEVKNLIVETKDYYVLTGFVPESRYRKLQNDLLITSPDSIVAFEEATKVQSGVKVPTKLINNKFIKPFESLVSMYSLPSYGEKDPTSFFAITYMILFGMMFGDLGQGLVIILAGFLLKKKLGFIADIMKRIGISSMIFGILYGSIFGMENLIPALFIRPMKSVSKILVYAIVFGIILLVISYFISFRNYSKRNERTLLIFGKNGISGFLFYIGFLSMILNLFIGEKLEGNLSSFISIVSVGVMVVTSILIFKEPDIEEKMDKSSQENIEKPTSVERGFELFEMIMSFFSNTVSFIRVGAFAINHVGLFMAFEALGKMTGNTVGSVIMIIVGNIVILVLEGLIVGIQAIRLEYYELFSKYYKGEGIKYDPIKIKEI